MYTGEQQERVKQYNTTMCILKIYLDYRIALYINKSQGMAISTGANITWLDHTLQQLIMQLALYKLGNLRESTQNTELFTLITGTKQHEKHSISCTGVVGLASPAARPTI